MMFPDEKTLKEKSLSYRDLFAPLSRFSRDNLLLAYTSGWGDAINHIKSAASEGFEAWLKKQPYGRLPKGEYCPKFRDGLSIGYQHAVISTAAKYEEKLREKDKDFAHISELMTQLSDRNEKNENALISTKLHNNELGSKLSQVQAENEQLKAAVKEFAEIAKDMSHPSCKQFLTLRMDAEITAFSAKHADLITKINKGK